MPVFAFGVTGTRADDTRMGAMAERYAKQMAALLGAVLWMCGCGGSNAPASTTSSTGSGSSSSTDMGTLLMPNYSNQFQLENAASGMVLGISGQSQAAGASVVQESNSSSTDSMWHFVPAVYSDDEMVIENMLTHNLIGFSASAPTSVGLPSAANVATAGTQAIQDSETGTDDQDWQFYLLSDGNYLIRNHYSGLYLEVENSSTSASATITQGARTATAAGCTCQEWSMLSTGNAAYPAPMAVTGSGIYVHDPNMIVDPSGVYWLYGTHNTLAKSTDLKAFTSLTADFTTEPSWWSTIFAPSSGAPDMWAPSVLYANGIYYQYYAVPVEPDTLGGEAVIALATSTAPSGPWTDQGVIISSWSNSTTPTLSGFGFSNKTTYNAIDPAPYVDGNGNWWLVYGSWFDGTHIVALDPSTGLLKTPGPDAETTSSSAAYRYWGEEGPFVYPWVFNGAQYYYYFASVNACCAADSTYRIVVGRSTNPTGPFYDRAGNALTQNGGTILLSTHGNIVGPGGQSVFTDTVSGVATPTLVYHYYDASNSGTPTLGLNRLGFTSDGWPYVE